MDIRPIDANALIDKLDNINPVDYGAMSSYETHNGARDALSDAVMHVNDAPTLSLNTLRDAIYQDAVEHGLWESTNYTVAEVMKEAERDGDPFEDVGRVRRSWAMETIAAEVRELDNASEAEEVYAEELADVVIASFSTAGYLGIDIDAAIRRKMEINKGRPWKHGKE